MLKFYLTVVISTEARSALIAQKKYIQGITILMIVIAHFNFILKTEEIFTRSS